MLVDHQCQKWYKKVDEEQGDEKPIICIWDLSGSKPVYNLSPWTSVMLYHIKTIESDAPKQIGYDCVLEPFLVKLFG